MIVIIVPHHQQQHYHSYLEQQKQHRTMVSNYTYLTDNIKTKILKTYGLKGAPSFIENVLKDRFLEKIHSISLSQ